MEELDVLYQGALFLSAGDGRRAEKLLLDTTKAAFRGHSDGTLTTTGRHPLEHLMLGRFLATGPWRGRAEPRPTRVPGERRDGVVSPDAFFRAAGAVHPRARAALWLVVVRRRSHAEAAAVLVTDDSGLRELLAYRDTFVSEAFRGSIRGPIQAAD